MQQGFFLMNSYFHRIPSVRHAHGGNLMTVYPSIVKAMAEQ